MPVNDIRVLSLDGGGSWAILQTMALIDLYGEATHGHEVLSQFDMAVANSGGSIVLAGLLLNWTPKQIFDMLNDEDIRDDIFVKNWGLNPGNRYNTAEKQAGFTTHYKGKNGFELDGTAYLADIVEAMHNNQPSGRHTEVVITGFDFDEDRAIFFKSSDGKGISPIDRQLPRRTAVDINVKKVSLVDACHVATNAPVVYFDDPAIITVDNATLRGWDGAIGGYNNPVLVGITESLTVYDCDPSKIKCLSIGTANSWQPLRDRADGQYNKELFKKPDRTSMVDELMKLAKAITGEPPSSASYVAAFMLGHVPPFDMDDFRLIRMNPMIQPVLNPSNIWECPPWAKDAAGKDDHEAFKALLGLDMDAVKQEEVDLITRLGKFWLQDKADNQLIVSTGNTARRKGFALYSEAKAKWESLTA